MFDKNGLVFNAFFFGGFALLIIAWIYTIVLACMKKHFGLAILFVVFGIFAVVYALRYPVRCKVPVAMFVVGFAMLGIALMSLPSGTKITSP